MVYIKNRHTGGFQLSNKFIRINFYKFLSYKFFYNTKSSQISQSITEYTIPFPINPFYFNTFFSNFVHGFSTKQCANIATIKADTNTKTITKAFSLSNHSGLYCLIHQIVPYLEAVEVTNQCVKNIERQNVDNFEKIGLSKAFVIQPLRDKNKYIKALQHITL